MEWISIKDKIPEKAGQYLVTNGAVILICGLLPSGVFYGIGGATHWMELPKLPGAYIRGTP